jgi:CHAT domain-containing protein
MRHCWILLLFAGACNATPQATTVDEIRALTDVGSRTEARELATGWLAGSPSGIERAHALNGLAQSWTTGLPADTARVRELTSEARNIARAANDSRAEAESLLVLGRQLAAASEIKEAQETLRQAVALSEAGQYPELPSALSELGAVLNVANLHEEARTSLERAIAMEENSPGPALASSLGTLAYTFFLTGDYPKSRKYAERAIGLFNSGAPRTSGAAFAHRILATALDRLGDSSGATAEVERAVNIDEAVFGNKSIRVADDRNVAGIVAGDSGDWVSAKRWFASVLAIYEDILGPDSTKTGGAANNLGQALVVLREYPEARRNFERSLAIQTKIFGPDNPTTANLYQGLARVANATGDYEAAKKLLEQNLAIWTVQLGPTHSSTLHSRTFLAEAMARAGDRAGALTMALDVARLRREYVSDTVRAVSETQALQIAGRNPGALDTSIALGVEGPAGVARAWDELIRSRALVLDEMAARYRAARSSGDPAMPALLAVADRARTELARAALTNKDSGLAGKRSALRRAEEALAAGSESAEVRLRRQQSGFAEVAASLPPGAALVAYIRFERPDFKVPDKSSMNSYAAFVLQGGPDAVPRAVLLGDAAHIDAQAAALGKEIARERDAAGHSERRNEESYRAAGDALRRSIWDPVAKMIGGAKQVYIVPDSALQLVNFAALPTGPARYLIETGPLQHVLSAERDLVQSRHLPPSGGNGLLAVGNPSFTTGAPVGCSGRFEPLPGSAREAAEVVSLWKALGRPAETLTGTGATEGALRQSVAGKVAIHIATHGFYIEDRCGGAGLKSENPLLRSGLMLSGGVFTAAQAASLNLDDAEWVVLSGCDTGLGDIGAGEGVLGLRRAFEEAGARTVVASLWPVDDDATRGWMKSLYRYRFKDGFTSSRAMRAAGLESLRTRRTAGLSTHPYYWASFVAVE